MIRHHRDAQCAEEKREKGGYKIMTCEPIYQGHIKLFSEKLCVLEAGARLHVEHDPCSRNSIVELLVDGVELKKL